MKYNDPRIPKWLQNNYNLQYIGKPSKATQIIYQRALELTYEKHPRIEEKNDIFVGRNEQINSFEERIDDLDYDNPICVVASGLKGIGRSSLLKRCLSKSNIRKVTYPYSSIFLNDTHSIEDFLIQLSDLGFTSVIDTTGLMKKTVSEKLIMLVEIVSELQQLDEIIFVIDNGCIIDFTGQISKWFIDLISDSTLQEKITFCLVSRFRLGKFQADTSFRTKQKFFSLEVPELSKKERDGLLKRYMEFEKIQLEQDDVKLISGLLTGFPEQVFFAVTLIKDQGIEYFRKNTYTIVDFNSKRANLLLGKYDGDKEKIEFLALLSSFDYIGTRFIIDIVGNEEKYIKYLGEFLSNAICEYVGTLKEYIRVNEVIKDYVQRNSYEINEKHKNKMKEMLKTFLEKLDNTEYDTPEYLFYLKEAMIEGKHIDDTLLIPSLYLKTMNELYIQRKNKEVVAFADKALEHEEFIDPRMIFELRYLLCSALAKLRDQRFRGEVRKIKEYGRHEADFYFLYAFYYRQIGQFEKALEMIDKSTEIRPKFSKANREKVQILIGLQEFEEAFSLSKENYDNYKDNPYHIQAYFICTIKSEKTEESRKILDSLIDALNEINTDVSKEMALRCKAQLEAFYNGNMEESLALIEEAIHYNSNLQYARLIKFDICERFNMIEEMRNIVDFFEQTEYKNKYKNNITCFKSIISAKEGKCEKAINYFKTNIIGYTERAKINFINKLKKIKPLEII